jgi:hypothetical protein
MNELSQETLPNQQIEKPNRRSFLRRMAGIVGAFILPPVVGHTVSSPSSVSAQENINATPDSSPKDNSSSGDQTKLELVEQITAENDLIPRKELLEKYNIQIIDSEKVTLDFRKSALEYKRKLFKNPRGTLKIVLLDGHFLHPNFLTEEQRKQLSPEELNAFYRDIEKAKNMVRSAFTDPKNVERKNQEFKNKMNDLESDYASGNITPDKYRLMQRVYEEEYRPFLKGPTDEDMLQDLMGMAPPLNEKNPNDPKTNRLIFLPVADPPKKIIQEGDEKYEFESDPLYDHAPRPEKSFPTTDGLGINMEEMMYPIKRPRLLSVTRHELEHAAGEGHPAADLNPYSDYMQAQQEVKNGNFNAYWVVFKHKDHGTMVGKTDDSEQKAA